MIVTVNSLEVGAYLIRRFLFNSIKFSHSIAVVLGRGLGVDAQVNVCVCILSYSSMYSYNHCC